MKRIPALLAFFFLITTAQLAFAGGGPQNVVLVVNSQSWASLAVANEYILLRGVPPNHVLYLDHVPNFETIDINTFREQILAPVLKFIDDRHLKPQIDYVIYSADMPYAVDTSADGKGVKLPQVFTRTASITSLTYLHERVMAKDIKYLQLNVNRYMRWTALAQDEALTEAEQKRYVEAQILLNAKEKKHDAALPILQDLAKAHPKNYDIQYNRACCLSRLKKFDDAMVALNAAIAAGWFNAYHTREDEDFAGMRGRQDFKDALAKLEQVTITTLPEHGFRSSYAWTPTGEIAADGQGDHYLLSTMLAVTSGRGTSVPEALHDLHRSVEADCTRPAGTIYYMVNGDVRSKTRRWAFTSAVKQLNAAGVKAEILEGKLPQKKSDVMGAMVGIADFDFAASGSTILPGAICEHLTSCGGELAQHRSQTECTAFMRFGASGTSGAVQEPFALQQKFPTPFIHLHYARGCTLAESFYQSVSGPYQLIVVGDPLCAPWKSREFAFLFGVNPGDTVKGTITLRPSLQTTDGLSALEFFIDGIRTHTLKPGENVVIDTAAYCDGHHDIELVSILAGPIESRNRRAFGVSFQNHGNSVALTTEKPTATWGETIRVSAQMPGATLIDVYSNGRAVGRIAGSSGELDIPTQSIGPGTVKLQAFGYKDAGEIVAAQSQRVTVVVGLESFSAQSKDPAATSKGLRLELDDGTVKVVEPTRDAKWLASAGLQKNHRCTLDAWFDVPANESYQFQIRSPMSITLSIDGKPQIIPATNDWRYIPISLQKGAHHLRFKADATNVEPTLDIRFGASGTKSIEAGMFQCVDEK
ncbi:MAG: tetratricopeptide repeat protein [Planctomycetota bacterium]